MDRSKKTDEGSSKSIYRIPPYYYIHVLDQNSNVTKLEVGPQTFIRQDNEKVSIYMYTVHMYSRAERRTVNDI